MNKKVLKSLKNVTDNEDKVVISDVPIRIDYWDSREYDDEQEKGRGLAGPRGWAGYSDKSVGYKLSVDVPTTKIEIIRKIMTALDIIEASNLDRHYKDNGLIFSLDNKVKGRNTINHELQIVKQSWFNEMLRLVQKYDPTYDEEKLMDIQEDREYSGYTYNTNAVSFLREPWTEYVTAFDDTVKVFNITVPDIDVPKHSKMIDSIIGLILANF
jgi:hypothetical protein